MISKAFPYVILSLVVILLGVAIAIFAIKPAIFDKYDIFVDLLIIVLALIGVAGYAIYRWVDKSLEARIDETMSEKEDLFTCRLFTNIGNIYWKDYEPKLLQQLQQQPDISFSFSDPHLEGAIDASERTLKSANDLDEKKHERVICICKNNLAYHLASRGNANDRDTARELAKYAYDRASKHGNNYHWKETYAWVLWRFAQDEVEKQEARRIISELKNDPSILDFNWRQNLTQKYSRLLQNNGN